MAWMAGCVRCGADTREHVDGGGIEPLWEHHSLPVSKDAAGACGPADAPQSCRWAGELKLMLMHGVRRVQI
jgi:hypothetical protein